MPCKTSERLSAWLKMDDANILHDDQAVNADQAQRF